MDDKLEKLMEKCDDYKEKYYLRERQFVEMQMRNENKGDG